jgi:hypothetical protein
MQFREQAKILIKRADCTREQQEISKEIAECLI